MISWILNMMVIFALIVFGLAVAGGSPVTNEEWTNFKKLYGKSYANLEEEIYREAVFDKKLQFIEEHNQRFLQGLETFDVGMNEFGDMTNEEMTSTMTGLLVSESDSAPIFTYDSADHVPDSVDWRDSGAVAPVKNQGACGSCYAFSAIGSLESQHFLKTGKLVLLSEQNAMDCLPPHSVKPNAGCHGDAVKRVFEYIENNNGIDTEESYPYEHKDAPCRFNASNVGATVSSHVHSPKNDEIALKVAVSDIGPISIGAHVGSQEFYHYKTGVFNDPGCPKNANHAMIIVGYGTEAGGDYWLVRNSWGHKWGDKGYIKMSRNRDNQCGIARRAFYPVV